MVFLLAVSVCCTGKREYNKSIEIRKESFGRIAALFDIHGNLPALEAVLEAVHKEEVDLIIAGGDVILGPMSKECLSRLMTLAIPVKFVLGNCESAVLNEISEGSVPELPESVLRDISWTADELTSRQINAISDWPITWSTDVEGLGKVMFCHATPRNNDEIFTKETSSESLMRIMDIDSVDVIICGHTHMQFDWKIGGTRVVNAGSVGMPFGKQTADWLLISSNRITFRHTDYDLDSASKRILNTSYSGKVEFVNTMLDPPSEREMLDLFSAVEIQ